MQPIIDAVAQDPETLVQLIALPMVGVIVIFALAIRAGNIKERERTRREIAAYVAEGTITPDDAERLLTANKPNRCTRNA